MVRVLASVTAGLLLCHCATGAPRHSPEAAARVLALRLVPESKELTWAFPTSSGRPVSLPAPDWVEPLVKERARFTSAVKELGERGAADTALELAAMMWRLWILAHDEAGGRAFLALVLDSTPDQKPSRARALALYGDSLLSFRVGDLRASRARSLAALDVARVLNEREAEGLARLALSRVELSENQFASAGEHAQAARALLRDLGPPYQQAALHLHAQAARALGQTEEAAALFAQSLALNRQLGDRGMVLVELHNLGHVELRRGNVDAAEQNFVECTQLGGASDDPYELALRLFNRAAVAHGRGDRLTAVSLLEKARSLLASSNVSLASDDAAEFADLERRLRAD